MNQRIPSGKQFHIHLSQMGLRSDFFDILYSSVFLALSVDIETFCNEFLTNLL